MATYKSQIMSDHNHSNDHSLLNSSLNSKMCADIANLLKIPENTICADCNSKDICGTSLKLGIFLCSRCYSVHQCLGADFANLKLLTESFSSDEIKKLQSMGNAVSKSLYERSVPACYKRPTPTDCLTLLEQWIRGKYERQEFIDGSEAQSYMSGEKDGYLWKRGKNDKHFKKRRFVLGYCTHQYILKYYNKESAKEPKAQMSVDGIDIILAPEKVGHPNSLHIVFTQDDSTRSIFLYADTGKDAIDWFTALRSAKLNRLAIAFPSYPLDDLCNMLNVEHIKEGWLMKAGPRPTDAYRRRWITLDKRKLLYYDDPLSAFPKGEVYLGSSESYSALEATDDVMSEFGIQLKTPQRVYHFNAETRDIQQSWLSALSAVINTPLNARDRIVSVKPKRGTNVRDSFMKAIKR